MRRQLRSRGRSGLTGVKSGITGLQLSASPPGRPVSVPPPAPPSCWRTAPSVTAVYPKGYSCFPCHQNSEAEAVTSASRPETRQVSSPVCVPGLEVGPTPPLASSFQQISSNHLVILKACRGIHPTPPHPILASRPAPPGSTC